VDRLTGRTRCTAEAETLVGCYGLTAPDLAANLAPSTVGRYRSQLPNAMRRISTCCFGSYA